jgi:hypothetical protein
VKNGKTAGGDRRRRAADADRVECGAVPLSHDVAIGWCANTRRKIYSADAEYEDQPSEKSVHEHSPFSEQLPRFTLEQVFVSSLFRAALSGTTSDPLDSTG